MISGGVLLIIMGVVWWLVAKNHWTTYTVQHPGQLFWGTILFWVLGGMLLLSGIWNHLKLRRTVSGAEEK